MTLGERIKKRRKELNITQTQLAKMIDKAPRTIQDYEANKATPPIAVIAKIARVLNISPGTLAYGKQPSHSKTKKELIKEIEEDEELIKEIEEMVEPLESTDKIPEKYVNIATLFRSLGFELYFYDEDEKKSFYLEPIENIEGLLFHIGSVFLSEEELDKINTNVYDYTLFQAVQLYNSKVKELKKNKDE